MLQQKILINSSHSLYALIAKDHLILLLDGGEQVSWRWIVFIFWNKFKITS